MFSLPIAQVIVLVVLGMVALSFLRGWLPVEVTALSATAVLMVAGILTPGDLFLAFSNPAPITVASMFILSAALEHTGVIDRLGRGLERFGSREQGRALGYLLAVPLVLSAFMNNIPVVVILLPVVLGFCRRSGAAPSRLLLPLSFAAILGGTCTMIGSSTNLIVAGVASDFVAQGVVSEEVLPPFSLFEISKLGVIYAAIGGIYLWIFAPRLLPNRETLGSILTPEMTREFLVQAEVPADSPLRGKTLEELRRKALSGLDVLQVRRRGVNLQAPPTEITVEQGDRLLIRTSSRGVHQLKATDGMQVGFGPDTGLVAMEEREATIMEGIIGPNSRLIGQTLEESGFANRYGLLLLAIHRQGSNITEELERLPLVFGDTLLVEGSREGIERMIADRDFISLSTVEEKPMRPGKAPFALAAMGGMIVLGAFGLPIAMLAFFAALVVVLTGCLRPQEAYQSMDPRTLFLIIGMLGVGRAMESTGASALIAQLAVAPLAAYHPVFLLAAVYFITCLFTEMVSNKAVAALVAPVAVHVALAAGLSPIPFLIAVMFASNASFASPKGYETNTYIYGPGGYQFRDFLRIGLPLNFILWIAASLLIPVFWPF